MHRVSWDGECGPRRIRCERRTFRQGQVAGIVPLEHRRGWQPGARAEGLWRLLRELQKGRPHVTSRGIPREVLDFAPTSTIGVEFHVVLQLYAKFASGVVTRTLKMHERNGGGVLG